MIKIEINAENGADARKELIDLLGLVNVGTLTATLGGNDPAISLVTERLKKDVTIGDGEHTFEELKKEEAVEPEKKKRRTKAEIEADKANTGSEEPPATEVKQETPDYENSNDVTIKVPELKDLQRVCAILVRAGYKQNGIDFIKNVGGAESSVEVPEGKRQAVIDAMTAFAEENKIAL